MLPRPGDSEQIAFQKLNNVRAMLAQKLNVFGVKPTELAQLGFDPTKMGFDDKGALSPLAPSARKSMPGLINQAVAQPQEMTLPNGTKVRLNPQTGKYVEVQ